MGSIRSLSIKDDKVVLKENKIHWPNIKSGCNNKTEIKIEWLSKCYKKLLT